MTTEEMSVEESAAEESPAPAGESATRRPLYPRLLRLRHIHPNAWQRALLGEGALGVAVLLVLADLATAWTLLVLPIAVALVVKAHDLLAGRLNATAPDPEGPAPSYDDELGLRGT
jgi:hypothetical protein